MDQEIISFKVSKELITMFELSLLLSKQDKDLVFENFVRTFAAKTLSQECQSEKNLSGSLNTFSSQEKNSFATETEKIYSVSNCVTSRELFYTKAERRIPLWANRKSQFNHQIIKAFFICENEGKAHRSEMKKIFLQNTVSTTDWQFENNFNSMLTEDGNSHGHIFDCNGDVVTVATTAQETLYRFKNYFI